MKVFAYCAESFRESARLAAGVVPMTCPPASAASFDVALLEGNGLLYFDLHGAPGVGEWHGDHNMTAVTAEQIRRVNLRGALVFAASCYLGDTNSPMLDALLSAGAKLVIAGSGKNFAGADKMRGASTLAHWFIELVQFGIDPLRALALAKKRIAVELLERPDVRKDTLEFTAYTRAWTAARWLNYE